jgi:hypothetical protein
MASTVVAFNEPPRSKSDTVRRDTWAARARSATFHPRAVRAIQHWTGTIVMGTKVTQWSRLVWRPSCSERSCIGSSGGLGGTGSSSGRQRARQEACELWRKRESEATGAISARMKCTKLRKPRAQRRPQPGASAGTLGLGPTQGRTSFSRNKRADPARYAIRKAGAFPDGGAIP